MAYYDEAQKKWIWEDQPKGSPDPMAPGAAALPSYFQRRQQEEQQALLSQDEQARKEFQSKPARPLLPKDIGQLGMETFKAAGNAVGALATDAVDMGLSLVDGVRALASPVTGEDYSWQRIVDDSDNPLTKMRRENIRMETELGQAAANVLRIGTAFWLFPKMAGRVFLGGAVKGAAVAEDVGKVVSKGRQIATTVGRFLEPMKPEAVTAALKTVRATELTSRAGKRAGRIAQGDEYLYATLRDYNRAARGALKVNDAGKAEVLAGTVDRWTALKVAAGKYTPNADKIKNFAQFAAWDAFVAFNIAGEGDYTMDETFGDMLEQSNNPYLRGIGRLTGTTPEMGALEVKGKQMLEGLVLGSIVESAFHYYRISRYVNAFQKATPTERAAIISAFEGEAEDIGAGISKSMGETDNIFSRAVPVPKAKPGPGVMTPQQPTNAELKAQFLAGRSPTEPRSTTRLEQQLGAWRDAIERQAQLRGNPNERGGALARPLESTGQIQQGIDSQMYQAWLSRNSIELTPEVQQVLEQMDLGNRLSGIELIERVGVRLNNAGMQNAADSLITNFIQERGLKEGWIQLDPDTFAMSVRRDIASELDAGDAAIRQGDALEATSTALDEEIASLGIGPVQEALGQMEARTGSPGVLRASAEQAPQATNEELKAMFFAAREAAQASKAEQLRMDEEAYQQWLSNPMRRGPQAIPPEPVAPPSGPVQEALGRMESMGSPGVLRASAEQAPQATNEELKAMFFAAREAARASRGDEEAYQQWLSSMTRLGREVGGPLVHVGPAKQPQLPGVPERAALPGAPERMALPQGPLFTPGLVDDAMREAAQADALDAKAQQELAKVLAGPKDQLSDEEAVRVAFGSGIDRLYVEPVVEKLANGPGFGVYGSDGELLKTFTSQRGADAYVKKVVASERQGFIDRARAMNAQAQPVELAMKYGSPYLDSDVVGKVKITSGQARALQALFMSEAAKPVIDRVVGAVWTPGMFRGIDDLMAMAKGSRMIEMSQSQMSQIVEAVTKAAASGEITTSQRTALNNMVQRLQETAELLEPEAIAKRDVQNILDAMATLSKTGEFCGVV